MDDASEPKVRARTTRQRWFGRFLAVWTFGGSLAVPASGQIPVAELKFILPSEEEVSNMVRLTPADNHLIFRRASLSELAGLQRKSSSPESTDFDEYIRGVSLKPPPGNPLAMSSVTRRFISQDRCLEITIEAITTDTVERAKVCLNGIRPRSDSTQGTFGSTRMLGDESYVMHHTNASHLMLRCGKLVIKALCETTQTGRIELQTNPIPPSVLDAFACRMLFAAARLHETTGLESKKRNIAVARRRDGKFTGIEILGHIFVSAEDACRAMDVGGVWCWNLDAVTIMDRQLSLFPGLVETLKGKVPGAKLKLPPFMYGDRCLMDLDELLSVIGTSRTTSGSTISIRSVFPKPESWIDFNPVSAFPRALWILRDGGN